MRRQGRYAVVSPGGDAPTRAGEGHGVKSHSAGRVALKTLADPVDLRPGCALEAGVDARASDARLCFVDVVLRKLGKGARAVAGRLVRAPRKGSVVVIEFPDGMHEYVTTPVKRVLRIAGREVFYIETINSRYRLEVRGRRGNRLTAKAEFGRERA
jgi:hypothetical protein